MIVGVKLRRPTLEAAVCKGLSKNPPEQAALGQLSPSVALG